MTLEMRLWLVSIFFFAAFLVLGILVSSHPLMRLDIESGAFRGTSTGLALLFTYTGRSIPLLVLGILSLVLFLVFHRPPWIPIAVFISQIASQGVAELVKTYFHRARPDNWLVHQELGHSFPSGHATTAMVFYVGWAILILIFPIARPLKYALATVLIAWAVGIDWSRMALSAHYFTDVLGGTMLGAGWLCAIFALMLRLRVPLVGP